jgi:predicted Zn-ribbon and HTH transcriptional regulator
MQTIRQQIIAYLSLNEHTTRDLSVALRIREKEVYDHLSHIKRTLASQRKRLVVKAAQCMECQYIFRDRVRLTKPSKCPRCKGTHIEDPKYSID